MNDEARNFLKSVFPERETDEIEQHFGDLFDEYKLGPDKDISKRKKEIGAIEDVIEELDELPDDEDGFKIRKACRDLSYHIRSFLKLDSSDAGRDIIVSRLTDYRNMSRVWDDHHPRLGGRDEHANILAEDVAYIFDELNEPVTEGTVVKKDQVYPSTRFGKIVKFAISYHEVKSDWLSPHRRVARQRKKC